MPVRALGRTPSCQRRQRLTDHRHERGSAAKPALDGTVSAAAAKIEPSLVTIAVQSGGSGGIGSGVVLDKDGHILTNHHVIAGAAQGGDNHCHLPQRIDGHSQDCRNR